MSRVDCWHQWNCARIACQVDAAKARAAFREGCRESHNQAAGTNTRFRFARPAAITSRARLGFPSPSRYRGALLSRVALQSARKRKPLRSWPWSCKNMIWSSNKHKRTRRRAYLEARRSATRLESRRRRISTASKRIKMTLQLRALRISRSRSSVATSAVNINGTVLWKGGWKQYPLELVPV